MSDRPPVVPDRSWYDPILDATLHTGAPALALARDAHVRNGRHVAIDIETPGLDRSFEINCITAAWREGWDDDAPVTAILLDPRRDDHRLAAGWLCLYAGKLIL